MIGPLVLLVILSCGRAAQAVEPAKPIILRSQKITLPFGSKQFEGEGISAKMANTRCLLCHSRGMVYTQPPLALSTWKAEVAKMESPYGCPLPPAQIEGLTKFIYEINQRSNKR